MSKPINNLPIDTQQIEEGLDRKQLHHLRQRFLQINQIRFERSCQALTQRQQQFLQLLPLLFHVNHPLLPGYLSHQVPCGVMHYQPQKIDIQLAKTFARSFHFPKELAVKELAIDALFVMGSPGTIAQNETSDLDIWICHQADLSPDKCQLLEHKADLLTEWAANHIHLNVHCFLMQSDAFKTEKPLAFNSEASGTAQYYLLLDEFYRTALWLAGKIPLWWFVPAERENDYEQYADTLLKKRFLKTKDVIDFGGVAKIPPEEYLGAGIWQLYKAIESPYKSVLKLLLLEIYATRENTALAQPLALSFKQAVYSGITDANQLDPYVFIYQRIEHYLKSIDNSERLDLIRRCFYFKVNRNLSREENHSSWQTALLKSMVDQWSWNLQKLQQLDNRSHWKADWVGEEHRLLVSELSHSYQLLNDLHKQLAVNASISRDQFTVLGRKLYAAFERRSGKVHLINPGISTDLAEEDLFFVQHQHKQVLSWSVYNQEPIADNTDAALKNSPQLIELLCWCCANGLIKISTKLHFDSAYFVQNFSSHSLVSWIKQWLPESQIDINHQAFHAPAYITGMLIIANLGNEPKTELHKKGMHLISSRSDALGYSGFRENLVQNLDCVYVNSWGEVVCRHFEKEALIQMMQYYLQLLGRQLFNFPNILFRCFSPGKGNLIAQRLEELWKHFHHCFFSSNQSHQRFLFEMADEFIIIESPLTSNEPVFRTQSLSGLLKKLGTPRSIASKLFIDPFALRNTPIAQINQTYSSQAVQLFYQIHQHQADIYLLDHQGAISYHRCYFHTQASLLRPIFYFLQNMVNKLEFITDSSQITPKILCYEIQPKNKLGNAENADWPLELRKVESDFRHLPPFSIKAIVEYDEKHRVNYIIYCNQQEFSSFVHGDSVFQQVADYIKQHRKAGEAYPCYITDLEISQQSELQLMECWQMKIHLEQSINMAYQAL